MKFGVTFFPTIGPTEKSAEQYYDECLGLARLADELDLTHVRTVEHYFFSYGGYSPDPVTFLSAVAACTSRVRLGTSAVIPAFTHPVKLAGKLAMLDNLSHGRLDAGFGRAFLPDEFAAFGVDMDESHARFHEGIAACKLLWSEEDVTWEGAYHSFGPVTLLPRPVQVPHPPVYVTTARSADSCATAGRAGHHLQMVGAILTRDQIQERIAVFRKSWADAGHEPGAEQIHLSYPVYLAESREDAYQAGSFDDARNGESLAAAVRAWATARSAAYPGYENLANQSLRPDFPAKVSDLKVLAGDPDDVAGQIRTIRDWFGDDITLSMSVHSGHLPAEVGARSMRLLAAIDI